MQKNRAVWGWIGALAMAVLILDSKTALQSGLEAVQMCITVLIPSLFPFFVFTPMVARWDVPLFKPLCRILRLSDNAGGILASGFFGGYPTGAQAVSDGVRIGSITGEDGRRMMAFCSNAGPAFLFGIGAQLFREMRYCWIVWGIHILSAVLVGVLTPGRCGSQRARITDTVTLTSAVKRAVMTMGLVCGWVVLFRILLAFCQRWFMWLLPKDGQVILSGILELANGCVMLFEEPSLGLQMTCFSVFLGFGGVCVWLQTLSAAEHVDCALYFPGKLAQGAISLLLSTAVQGFLPQAERYYFPVWTCAVAVAICTIYPIFNAKVKIKGGNSLAAGI